MNLSLEDCNLFDRIQKEFPICERPFKVLGDALGLTEEAVLHRIKEFKEERIIRQISAIFDSRALGYSSALVAMNIPQDRLARAVEIINGHPGVSHHYQRSHAFNVWFTIAVAPGSLLGLKKTVEIISKNVQPIAFHIFPALKVYKIGVFLPFKEDSAGKNESFAQGSRMTAGFGASLTSQDIALIMELQEDLEIVREPFLLKARRLGISQQEIFMKAGEWLEKGLLRRFCAVFHHQKAGFTSNAMVVWKVPEGDVDRAGHQISLFHSVSHCYLRPVFPDWPYAIFSMIHGRSREECDTIIREISKETALREYKVLYTTAEYKKNRIKYFSPEFNLWEKKYG